MPISDKRPDKTDAGTLVVGSVGRATPTDAMHVATPIYSIERNDREGGECAVSFSHCAFSKRQGWREGETGLTPNQQLDGEDGGKNVREQRHGLSRKQR